ncbi:MAG: hypothetical protein LBK01_04580 [Burkholderiaceae bacterium]|jgi:hypothetical protein|nr:hypothetical protein [Burkholderiaceae bacterium]
MKPRNMINPGRGTAWRNTLLVALSVLFLSACARPNDSDVRHLLSEAYKCQWLKVESYEKVESLAGLWSYVVRYQFRLVFPDGDAGAKHFFRSLYHTTPGVTDYKEVLRRPSSRAFLDENCSGEGKEVLQQMAIQSYMQLSDDASDTIQVPLAATITGWAEMTPGKAGWNMDMRRDKLNPKFALSSPVKKRELLKKRK